MLKRFRIAGFLLVATLAGAATIVTTRSAAKVYPNPIRRVFEQPIFVLEKGEVVEVLQWGKPLTQIRNRRGRVGYVDIDLLDSLRRPPILRLMIDSTSNGPVGGASALPAKTRQQAKVDRKVATMPDSAKQLPEKPVDFQGDSTHITPRSTVDTTKH
jgi:hypothetical protein